MIKKLEKEFTISQMYCPQCSGRLVTDGIIHICLNDFCGYEYFSRSLRREYIK